MFAVPFQKCCPADASRPDTGRHAPEPRAGPREALRAENRTSGLGRRKHRKPVRGLQLFYCSICKRPVLVRGKPHGARYRRRRGARDRASLSLGTGEGGLFVCFLLETIVIVGGLTYLPALALGPIIESLQLSSGTLY
jgi:hypothetical protein